MIHPFVIIGRPRSGTTFFRRTLSMHPEIECYGEIFKEDVIAGERRLRMRGLGADIAERNADPVGFLDKFLACHERGHIGFKIMLNQNEAVIDEVYRRQWPIIVIRRDNFLARFSSGRLAKATGQSHARRGVDVKRAEVEFKPGPFDRFIRREGRIWQRCFDARPPAHNALMLEYCELAFGDAITRAFEFLNVEPIAVEPDLQKKNSSNIASRFTNPDDVVAYLEKTGRTEWLIEQPVESKSGPEVAHQ